MFWIKKLINQLRHNEGRPPPITVNDLSRIIIHIPWGILSGLLVANQQPVVIQALLIMVLGLLFSWGFIRYELNEDRHEKDKAFKDIIGWLVGLAIVGIARLGGVTWI